MTEQQRRQTAYKVSIRSILDGEYIRQEGWNPNYIVDRLNRKVSRVNMLCTIVNIPDEQESFNYISLILDDGTGTISTRSFEDHQKLKGYSIGDIIQIIGKIREYGTEKYITPEIISKIKDPKWIEVRKKEMDILNKSIPEEKIEEQETKIITPPPTTETITIKEAVDVESNLDSSEKIIEYIRTSDKGDGIDIDDVINKCNIDDCENTINSLLMEGDLFEIKPGRLKVLD